jgi:P-type Cu2+ transporter
VSAAALAAPRPFAETEVVTDARPATVREQSETQPETTILAVPGLRCAGCIAKIEDGIGRLPGIAAVRVNFTARQVSVAHDSALQPPDIQAALMRLGFEAEPLKVESAGASGAESRRLALATAVAGFASMNVMLLSVSVWSGATGATRDLFHLISAAIAIPTLAYSGQPFFRSALGAIRHGRTNMDVPISVGVLLVTALSLHEALTSGPHAYFDGVVMLLFFLLVGRLMDSVMRDRARDGVANLLRQTAPGALVIGEDDATVWRRAEDLVPGMRILVAAGERFAADGTVEKGRSSIDLSLLSGESAPELIREGGKVHAGTLNVDGPLTITVTAAGPDTAIADIARMMENAGQARSRYVRYADRAARWYAPAVHSLAAAAFISWMVAGVGWHQSMMVAAAVLIITCPCALGLAVPAAQVVASGTLMRRGVLIKDGSALERLAEVDRALFDKTGTLTLGRPNPVDLDRVAAADRPILLALARASRHPLSQALRRELEAEGVRPAELGEIAEEPGHGLTAWFGSEMVALERPASGAATLAASFRRGGRMVTLHFEDAIRPGAEAMVARLGAMGIPASIVSGDRAEAVAPVARALRLTAQTAMRPEDKIAAIARLSNMGRKVLMVGDGLNDGPALAAGHVSMAPASASDVGQSAADAVFLGDGLGPVADAVTVARQTMRIVRQNIAIAIAYNVVAVPLAFAGLVTPLVAALAMSGSSIIVVANALRLKSTAR